MKNIILALSMTALVGCGGGGSSDSGSVAPAPAPSKTVLEGTWIAASDSHPTGSACGLSLSGAPGTRQTVTFAANTYAYKLESCIILTGNTGGYVMTDNVSGTFLIGGINVQSSDPTAQMTALDLISQTTSYTSFNISGSNLHIAGPFQEFDGSTPAKRAFQINSFFDPVSGKLIDNATFIKQ